jgi:hypothetical protein
MGNNNDIIVYQSEDGNLSFDVRLEQDTVWLTQAQIAELFEKHKMTISEHIKNIFFEGELDENSVVRNFLTTANDSKKYQTNYYNLDVIISVGYRVKSQRGTQFRIWATNILRSHLLNGFSVNKRKLESIEKKIDLILKKEGVQNDQIKQLQDDQFFIKKMLQPNPIINKIYIDTKPLIEATEQNAAEFKAKLTELNTILKDIETKLPSTSELKIFIKDVQDAAQKAQKDPMAKNKLLKTISDLGDSNSSISKMLTGAGVTKHIIQKTYEIGMFLVRYLPF